MEFKNFIIQENIFLTLKTKETKFIFHSKNEIDDFGGYGKTIDECIIKINEHLKNKPMLNELEQKMHY